MVCRMNIFPLCPDCKQCIALDYLPDSMSLRSFAGRLRAGELEFSEEVRDEHDAPTRNPHIAPRGARPGHWLAGLETR